MPLIFAIGFSVVSVAAFGLTTAGNSWLSGLIHWELVGFFIGGGVVGGVAGRDRLPTALPMKSRRSPASSLPSLLSLALMLSRGVLPSNRNAHGRP